MPVTFRNGSPMCIPLPSMVNLRMSLSCRDPRILRTVNPRCISPYISTYRSRIIESVIVEICASVTEVPPMRLSVVAVKRPAISCCLTTEVRAITNSRKLLTVEMCSRAERLSMAIRFGLNSLIIQVFLNSASCSSIFWKGEEECASFTYFAFYPNLPIM